VNPLKTIFCFSAFILIASGVFSANPSPMPSASPSLPTLEDETAKGFIPYHQLTVDDFPINDQVHPDARFWVKTFVHPYWWAQYRFSRFSIYAYIGGWVVFSGLDKSESSRKGWFGGMQTDLPYAQALLDINEIHARRLAAFRPGELPRGQGTSQEATRADLTKKMKLFCEREYESIQAEMDEFTKATNKGSNQKKVRELGAEIKKRLAAVPLPSPPLSGVGNAAATPVATATASRPAALQSK
jgi:hypothetical protein